MCNSCTNNAENIKVKPDEIQSNWKPCYFCDICSNYDSESHENMEREECSEYVIDNYHAEQNRKKFRIVR